MNTAQSIIQSLSAGRYAAVTFRYGYATPYPDTDSRLLFEPGREIEYKRNTGGRCTRAVFQYADGSKILFKWSEFRGSSWSVES